MLDGGEMLITTPNLSAADDIYARLIAAHETLSEAESHKLNAKLVLIFMNHVGDSKVIEQALDHART